MDTFVLPTAELTRAKLWLLCVNTVHFIVLSTYLIGHVHRGLCADVSGLCKPMAASTVYMLPLVFPDICGVVMSFMSLFPVNSPYVKSTLAMTIAGLIFTTILVILRSAINPGILAEDPSFRIFAVIVGWALFGLNVFKTVVLLAFHAAYRKWEIRAASVMKLTCGVDLLNQLAKIPSIMGRARATLYAMAMMSFTTFVLYLAMSFIFVWFPHASNVLPSRSFFIVQVLCVPRIYDFLILVACVGMPELLDQTKEFVFVIANTSLFKTVQLACLMHMAFASVVAIIHVYTLVANISDLTVFEAVWAGIMSALAFAFFLIDMTAFFAASAYIAGVQLFFSEIVTRAYNRPLPQFPLAIINEAEDIRNADMAKMKRP